MYQSRQLRTRLLSTTSAASGFAGFLGSWQICHNLCLGSIAALSFFGVVGVGMPLVFLNRFQIYFWTVAVGLLLVLLLLRARGMRGLSTRVLIFNTGVVVVGTPFVSGPWLAPFWIVGGSLVAWSIGSYLYSKIGRRKLAHV